MRKSFFTIIVLMACSQSSGRADIILNYEGQLFNTILSGADFTISDRITGTIVFDDFTPLGAPATVAAKSFTLSTTVGGAPGFQFMVADAATDARVTLNSFDFSPGSLNPTGFGLTVSGDEFGAVGLEELAISDIGDLATIDFLEATESSAFNTTAGSFTAAAVPEPSSFAILTILGLGFAFKRLLNSSPNS